MREHENKPSFLIIYYGGVCSGTFLYEVTIAAPAERFNFISVILLSYTFEQSQTTQFRPDPSLYA